MAFSDDGYTPTGARAFGNDVYTVLKYINGDGTSFLSIQRRDGEPIRSWADLQAIKNEVLGLEVEAIELFPADSRLVDAANITHLWALPTGIRFPIGFRERWVPIDSQWAFQTQNHIKNVKTSI